MYKRQALGSGGGGDRNLAIGISALRNSDGYDNIAFGYETLLTNTTGSNNIAIGALALKNANTSTCVAIGNDSQISNISGVDNLTLGYNTLKNNATGERNIVIGNNSGGSGATSGSIKRNIVIGGLAGYKMTTGADYNTIVGHSAGSTMTTGNNNILIGYNVHPPADTDTFRLNIGNLIYGRMSALEKRVGINVVPNSHLHLPASEGTSGQSSLKINAGILLANPEDGAIEFDGTNLYFTNSSGVRKTLAVVA